MKKIFKCTFITFSLFLGSCNKQLNQSPKYGLNAEAVYSDPNQYIQVLAKLYSGISMTGNQGPSGQPDIAGIDEGFSSYLRVLWNLQELPTDEAINGWTDPGIPDLDKSQWNADNAWVKGMYYRVYFQITLCNEFIWQAREEKLTTRGFSEAKMNEIRTFREEARFLRAMAYYHALDLFGNVPFVTENDRVGAFEPEQIKRADLFKYIEDELKDVETKLMDPMAVPYGRASKAAAQTLLAKMYLNAETYLGGGNDKFTECATYCEKVMNSGAFSLDDHYQDLFLADNFSSPEIIFPIVFNGKYAQTWGGTTYLVCGAIGGSMNAMDYGVNGKWGGLRAKPNLVDKFPDSTLDTRWTFYTDGQQKEITSISTFAHGYANPKFKNRTSTNGFGTNNGFSPYTDIDFPMFRLADVYLMYAEAQLRLGNSGTAVQYVNYVRSRGYGNTNYNVTNITLNDILDERARELNWEGTRRTDLIRFGLFTSSSYLWPFKGGDVAGEGLSSNLNLYPIPTSDLVINRNLTQNPGY